MRKLAILLLLVSPILANQASTPQELSSLQGDPSALIYDCVNAITGDLVFDQYDVIVKGTEPIPLRHRYISREIDNVALSWAPFYHTFARVNIDFDFRAYIKEANGYTLLYIPNQSRPKTATFTCFAPKSQFSAGIVHQQGYNPIENTVQYSSKELVVHQSNNSYRVYRKFLETDYRFLVYNGKEFDYLLDHERLSNGNFIHYVYTDKKKGYRLSEIYTTNPSKTEVYARIEVGFDKDTGRLTLNSSDNHELRYEQTHCTLPKKSGEKKKRSLWLLKQATCSEYPKETRTHNKQFSLATRSFPEGRTITASYDKKNRVKELKGPKGRLCSIEYHDGYTEVIDTKQNRTYYFYDLKTFRLDEIKHTQFGYNCLKTEAFKWSSEGLLLEKQVLDKHNTPLLTTTYTYDKKHNLASKTLTGTITQEGCRNENYTISYTYDECNRLVKQIEDNGATTTYTYLEGTNLPTSKVLFKENQQLKRILYSYNEDNILICEITDDGPDYTERHVKRITPRSSQPYYGLPEMVKKLYQDGPDEVLLQKTHLTYDTWGNITKKTIYDAQNKKRYTLSTIYNEKGQIIQETDALGNTTKYAYDENGNQIRKETPQGLLTEYTYDTCNRLLKKKESSAKETYITQYKNFDPNNSPQSIIAPTGGLTRNTYDLLGNLLVTIDPIGAQTTHTYNTLGHTTSTTDAHGHTAAISYNIYGSPLSITHPDGTKECYIYNLDGAKASYTDQNGTKTTYNYDLYGNVEKEVISAPDGLSLAETTKTYTAFHLLSETNPEGYTTTYTYNQVGQLVETSYENTINTYSYDSLDRQITETTDDYTREKTYDYLSRVIEEKEFFYDKLLSKTLTRYNDKDNSKTTTTFPNNTSAQNQTEYDAFGREIRNQDPLSCEYITTYCLGDKQLRKIILEPENLQTIETHNALNQLISVEKRNASDTTIARSDYTYDLIGNKILETTTIYQDAAPKTTHTISYAYDSLNRKISETESQQKTTSYTYTPTGQLRTLTTPNKTTLTYTYDLLGNRVSLISSDGSIHYTYIYNKLGKLLSSYDHIQGTSTSRILDAHGNTLQEILANGHTISSTYDHLNRRTELHLPHQTLHYTYQGPYLTAVSTNRLNHTYVYDLDGNLLLEQQIDGSQREYTLDSLARPTSLASPHFTQSCTYSPRGNITYIDYNNTAKTYAYDDLDHLIEEPGHHYTHDSIHNRTSKDQSPYAINQLNQIQNTSTATCQYDQNGNLIQKNDICFKYDALDRLTAVITPSSRTTYSYDAQHRRLTKNNEAYIWDGQHELGTTTCYRILGSTSQAEIGSAVAIYLNNTPYVPIHDLQGNLIQLHTLDSTLIESRTFTAFGEVDIPLYLIPWGFSSKRHDPETSLIYFGRRYYDPHLGRFITTDPEGYTDSANLYAYVCNNPLTHHDLYGLIMTHYNPQWVNSSATPYNPYERYTNTNLEDLYQSFASSAHNLVSSPRFQGSMQALGGLTEVGAGGWATFGSGGLAAPVGFPVLAHGLDQFMTGMGTTITGRYRPTVTEQLLHKTGIPSQTAGMINDGLSIVGTMGAAAVVRASQLAAFPHYHLPTSSAPSIIKNKGWMLPKNGGGALISDRWYTEHALERMAPRTPRVMAELESRFLERSKVISQKLSSQRFREWCLENAPNPRGIPPSIVQAEIAQPGSTGVRVILNKKGHVITVIPGGQ